MNAITQAKRKTISAPIIEDRGQVLPFRRFRESETTRLYRALTEGGAQTALSLGRRAQLRTADVWEWAARKAGSGKLGFDPETQRFSLPADEKHGD